MARLVAGWLFGLSVTVLLIGVWGRAIVIDTDTLGESLTPMSESTTVVDLFADWLGTELRDAGVPPDLADGAVADVLGTSAVGGALERFVAEVVAAAASSSPAGSSVDIGGLLRPAVPEIVDAFEEVGVPITEARVVEVVEDLNPLVVRPSDSTPYVGAESPVATRLGTAAGLAILVMLLAGGIAIAAASDRIAEIRRLFTRIALGGLSFGILLRVGSWILDPGGGRAPVTETVSALAGSKWLVPIGVGVVAGVVAVGIWGVRRLIRPGEESRTPDVSPTLREEPLPSHP